LILGCFPLEEVIGVRVPDRQLRKELTKMTVRDSNGS
jgi:hypothetical protein